MTQSKGLFLKGGNLCLKKAVGWIVTLEVAGSSQRWKQKMKYRVVENRQP